MSSLPFRMLVGLSLGFAPSMGFAPLFVFERAMAACRPQGWVQALWRGVRRTTFSNTAVEVHIHRVTGTSFCAHRRVSKLHALAQHGLIFSIKGSAVDVARCCPITPLDYMHFHALAQISDQSSTRDNLAKAPEQAKLKFVFEVLQSHKT